VFQRVFRRSRRLRRGLPMMMVNSDTRWLVKSARRSEVRHNKLSEKLKKKERVRNVFGLFGWALLGVSVPIMAFLGYVHVVPTSVIAQVSPASATWVDDLRLSGCSETYVRWTFSNALSFVCEAYEGKRLRDLTDHIACANERMSFPA
jgi:hypothetical protein